MKNLLSRWFTKSEGKVDRYAEDRREFTEEVKKQFMKLKDKGLSIPIYTL